MNAWGDRGAARLGRGAPSATALDELRGVIRRIEQRRPPRPVPEPVERVVGGALAATEAGPLVVVRREYPLGHLHGRATLRDALAASADVLGVLARAGGAPSDPRGLLFLDAETTGLAGGTGTYAFLVGVGALDEDRLVLTQFFMRDFDEEPALLAALTPLLEQASGVVTFNGTGFDLPLLETRFVLARRRWPGLLPHVDLLRPARRVWSLWLEDCRLGTLERSVLGVERIDDVPGSLIPALYFDFLRSRRAAPLARVFAHNRDDVLSLVALLGWFGRTLADGDRAPLAAAELAGLAHLLEPVDAERGAVYYRAALDAGLDGRLARRVRLWLAHREKRRACWEAACTLWEAALGEEGFDVRPWEELAKYYEHRRRDAARARALVSEALGLAQASGAGPRALAVLGHRLARLERRLGLATPATP